VRDSSSVAYLAPALAERKLKLLIGCTVTRVLFDCDHCKTARGVECVDKKGHKKTIYAKNEVIISAGPLGSPKILFNSGIGPQSVLRAFGKPERQINELIGQKIRNQLRFGMNYQDLTVPNPNMFALPSVSVQFAQNGSGIFGLSLNIFLSVKVNPIHPVNDVFIQSGLGTFAAGDLYLQTFPINVGLTYNNYANGTLNLTTSNPLDNTVFTGHFYEIEDDINTTAYGVIAARQVMANYPNAIELFPGPGYSTVDSLIPLIKQRGFVSCHFSSSVPIGDTPASPLDLRMRVRGIHNLRVVDASVLPGQVSNGMQAPATVMGEKGAEMIIEDTLNL